MESKQPSPIDLLVEAHAGLERQGPGCAEETGRALAFLGDLDLIANAADLGCGTGAQTLLLAQHLKGSVVGLDLFPAFVDVLNGQACEQGVADRVRGVVGSMDDLPFQRESLDLIWSEGAIDNIGFEKGLAYWRGFLKQGGYVAVTCPSWLTDERPAVIERFWTDAGSRLDSVASNIEALQRCGYQFVAAFALPETCWTDEYCRPRAKRRSKACCGITPATRPWEAFVADNRHEVELYQECLSNTTATCSISAERGNGIMNRRAMLAGSST